MDKIAEFFNGTVYPYKGIPQLRVAKPWWPVWRQRTIDNDEGENYRPEYYRETNVTYDNKPTQAVRTSYSTHQGGVTQGPLAFPKGLKLHFQIYGMMKTHSDVDGEGRLFAFITEHTAEGGISFVPQYIGDDYTGKYNNWLLSGIDYITTGNPIYVGGWSSWKYRSPLCCTLWGHALLTVKDGYDTESLPVVKTIEHPDYTVEFLMRIRPK